MASVLKSADNGLSVDDKIPLLNLDKSPLAKIKSLNSTKRDGQNGATAKSTDSDSNKLNGRVPTPASKPKPPVRPQIDGKPAVTKPTVMKQVDIKSPTKPATNPAVSKPADTKSTTLPVSTKSTQSTETKSINTPPVVKKSTTLPASMKSSTQPLGMKSTTTPQPTSTKSTTQPSDTKSPAKQPTSTKSTTQPSDTKSPAKQPMSTKSTTQPSDTKSPAKLVDAAKPKDATTYSKPPIKISHSSESLNDNKQPKPPVVNRSVSNLTEASTAAFKKLSVHSVNTSSKSLDTFSCGAPSTLDIATMTNSLTDVPQILLRNKKVLEEESKVLSLDWSADSKQIVTSLQSGHLCIWEVLNKDRIYAVQTPCTWVFTAAFSPSQGYIAAGGLDSKCDVYKIPRGKQPVVETQHVAQHQSYVLACMFTSSDHQILTASSDKTSGLWDVESSHLIREFKGHTADVTSLDFQKSTGHCFATGSADHQIALWDMRSGLCVSSFASHTDEVNQVKFFPSGDAIASVSDDMTCQLFDLRMNARLATFKRSSILFPACSLDFSLNGRMLFVGYGDHSFHVWDTLKGSHCGCMYSHENKVNVLKLSPDGSYLATGSWDQSVKLWSC